MLIRGFTQLGPYLGPKDVHSHTHTQTQMASTSPKKKGLGPGNRVFFSFFFNLFISYYENDRMLKA